MQTNHTSPSHQSLHLQLHHSGINPAAQASISQRNFLGKGGGKEALSHLYAKIESDPQGTKSLKHKLIWLSVIWMLVGCETDPAERSEARSNQLVANCSVFHCLCFLSAHASTVVGTTVCITFHNLEEENGHQSYRNKKPAVNMRLRRCHWDLAAPLATFCTVLLGAVLQKSPQSLLEGSMCESCCWCSQHAV